MASPVTLKTTIEFHKLPIHHFVIDDVHIDGGKEGVPAEVIFHAAKNIKSPASKNMIEARPDAQTAKEMGAKIEPLEDIYTLADTYYKNDTSPIRNNDLINYPTYVGIMYAVIRAQVTQNSGPLATFINMKELPIIVQNESEILSASTDTKQAMRTSQQVWEGVHTDVIDEKEDFGKYFLPTYSLGIFTCTSLKYNFTYDMSVHSKLYPLDFYDESHHHLVPSSELYDEQDIDTLSTGRLTDATSMLSIVSEDDLYNVRLEKIYTLYDPEEDLNVPYRVSSSSYNMTSSDSEESYDITLEDDSSDNTSISSINMYYGEAIPRKPFHEALTKLPGSHYIKICPPKKSVITLPVEAIVSDTGLKYKNAGGRKLTGVNKKIFKAGGDALKEECNTYEKKTSHLRHDNGRCYPGEVIVTSSGKMRKKEGPQMVFHTTTLNMKNKDVVHSKYQSWEQGYFLNQSYTNIFTSAMDHNKRCLTHDRINAILIPPIGIESLGHSPDISISCMVDALREHAHNLAEANIMVVLYCQTSDVSAAANKYMNRFIEEQKEVDASFPI